MDESPVYRSFKYGRRKSQKQSFARRLVALAPVALLSLIGVSGSSFAFLPSLGAHGTIPSTNARIFTEGLTIKLDRSSPAFAALEDEYLESIADASAEVTRGPAIASVSLDAGLANAESLATRIMKANQREDALLAQERASKQAAARLFAQAATEAFKGLNKPEAATAKAEAGVINHPVRRISLKDLQISREELIGGLVAPLAKAAQEAQPRREERKPLLPIRVSAAEPANDESENSEERSAPVKAAGIGTPDAAPSGPVLRQVILTGPLEFAGGLALASGEDRVAVFRERDGETLESGQVWLREGRYEIFVDDTEGDLIGELVTAHGEVLGRGIMDLSKVRAPMNARRVEKVALKIRPVIQGITGRVASLQSPTGLTIPVANAQVFMRDLPLSTDSLTAGKFREPNLFEGSNVIVETKKPGQWDSIGFARAGRENEITVLPKDPGQVMAKLLNHYRLSESTIAAIAWGRVTRQGQPLAGVRVDVVTTEKELKPIYFNSAMEPDPKLTTTSANGLYAFLPLNPGAHGVVARIGERSTVPLLFPAVVGATAKVDIELSGDRRAKVKVFDAFNTERPLEARLTPPGSDQGLDVDPSGETSLKYASGESLLILDADAGNAYQRTRVTMSRDRRSLFVPVVPTVWLERMRGRLRINNEPRSGSVVGFIQGNQPFKVAMEERSVGANSRIAYFNDRGDFTGTEFGEPGGGFVLMNVPEGFRSISVQPSGSAKIHASVMLIESGVTNVMTQTIR